MEDDRKDELKRFLKVLPPVEFCCVYGSSLHQNNQDKTSMVDYILGVSDPLLWHSQNLELNRDHYSSWLAYIDRPKLITGIAHKVGVGVHFNPFVTWDSKIYKYGIVRMNDLVQDLLNWDRFYLSGRLQKPVHILVDNSDIGGVNSANLRAAVSAALLLLPSQFSEEDLYAKICSLSYMGDVRMLFAEDRNKVRNIVQGQYNLFQTMYKPFLEEYESENLISFSAYTGSKAYISQDCDLSATQSLVSTLPPRIKSYMGLKFGEKRTVRECARAVNEVMIGSREEASKSMQKVLRRTVMVSSARQAVSGFLTAGGLNAARYVAKKMSKAWKSMS